MRPTPDALPAWEDAYLGRLEPDLQNRYRALQNPGRRLEWLCARVLLIEALARRHALEPSAIDTGDNGQPLIAGGLHCSISHSRGLVAVALGTVPVGLDIEYLRRQRPLDALNRHLDAAERQAFSHPADSPAGIEERLRAWTYKEAVVKTVGMTVWDGLKSVRLVTGDAGRTLEIGPPLPTDHWAIRECRLCNDWHGALALLAPGSDDVQPKSWALSPKGELKAMPERLWHPVSVSPAHG